MNEKKEYYNRVGIVPETKVFAKEFNKSQFAIPTGEEVMGSLPVNYYTDIGAANAYSVIIAQGKARSAGINTTATAFKLIDSGATFIASGIKVDHIVLNLTDTTEAKVLSIDSETQLTLDTDIFTDTTKSYKVGADIFQLPLSYIAGQAFKFKAANTNTGASTININAIGAIAIKRPDGSALIANDIIADRIYAVIYNGANFILSNVIAQDADKLQGFTANNLLRRCVIINKQFSLWQRGTSFTADGYTADRWLMSVGGGGAPAATISRQDFTLGQTDVPNEPEHYLRFNQTSVATTNEPTIVQKVENVRTFADKTVVVSFYAKADDARDIDISLVQNFGTGGSPSGEVESTPDSKSLTTSWQKFTYSVTLASLSGKTIGTDGNDYLELKFELPLNVTFTIDFSQIQLEIGSVATDFEYRSIGEELILCQRYYEKSYNLDNAPGTVTDIGRIHWYQLGNTPRCYMIFRVVKRNTPTVVIYATTTGNSGHVTDNFSGFLDKNANADDIGENGFTLLISEALAGPGFFSHYIADAEL